VKDAGFYLLALIEDDRVICQSEVKGFLRGIIGKRAFGNNGVVIGRKKTFPNSIGIGGGMEKL